MIYDHTTSTFTYTPDMTLSRKNPACALFRSAMHNNRYVVLAAGGSAGQTQAEVFDYTNPNASAWDQSKKYALF